MWWAALLHDLLQPHGDADRMHAYRMTWMYDLAQQGGWQGRRAPVAHAGLKPLYLEYSSNQ